MVTHVQSRKYNRREQFFIRPRKEHCVSPIINFNVIATSSLTISSHIVLGHRCTLGVSTPIFNNNETEGLPNNDEAHYVRYVRNLNIYN